MRGALLAGLLLGACAAPGVSPAPEPAPPAAPSVSPDEASFQLLVHETVVDPTQEGRSYTVAFVDGSEAGRTRAGPQGSEKRLLLALAPGNRLLRLEHWLERAPEEWALSSRQPRERFVRVEDGFVTRVFLRYPAAGAPELLVQREPKGGFRLEP